MPSLRLCARGSQYKSIEAGKSPDLVIWQYPVVLILVLLIVLTVFVKGILTRSYIIYIYIQERREKFFALRDRDKDIRIYTCIRVREKALFPSRAPDLSFRPRT